MTQDPYPSYAGGPVAETRKPFSTMAIVGFVLAFFVGLVGLILSLLALRKTGATGPNRGRGLAIGGVVVSVLNMLGSVVYQLNR